MPDKYIIVKVSSEKGSRWILYLNDEYIMDYKTRKDARAGRKAWMDLMDFSNLPPMPQKVRIFRDIYP